jgi:hypothetical protein
MRSRPGAQNRERPRLVTVAAEQGRVGSAHTVRRVSASPSYTAGAPAHRDERVRHDVGGETQLFRDFKKAEKGWRGFAGPRAGNKYRREPERAPGD